MKYYLIFRIDSNDRVFLLNMTCDYYYARRLYRRYKKLNYDIYFKSIYDFILFENSVAEGFVL